jgi:hypothetical protein
MTISLAFFALNLVKAAVEGRLRRGISIERLRDPPTEWSRQLRRSASNRNSCSAAKDLELQPKGRFTGACAVGLHAQGWPPGTEFLDAEQGAKNRHRNTIAQLVAGIVVHRDKLIVQFKSDHADEASDRPDDQSLTILWQKPPSKKSRRILLPHNASRSDVRPEQFERRARLVSAIARSRRWLDDVISGRVTTVAELCAREKCSIRQVNMTISLAFLAPNLVKAAIEGRLPRGIGIERLRDPPTEWSRQFDALGLNPE